MRNPIYVEIVVGVTVVTMSPCFGGAQHDRAPVLPPTTAIMMAQAAPKATSPVAVVRAVKIVISGKVQGVGFRDWIVRRAGALGVRGWVENANDGTVHALFGGTEAAVEAMLAACHKGPSGASVRDVAVSPADVTTVPKGFRRGN